MSKIPKVIYKNGFLRVRLPNGGLLPETKLQIENSADQKGQCMVTVSFLCDLDLKEEPVYNFAMAGEEIKAILHK
jgi:hypothetical protein